MRASIPGSRDARQLTVTHPRHRRRRLGRRSCDVAARKGVGLRNVERRLQGQYGAAASLSIESAPGRGTTVEVRIARDLDSREAAADRVAV